MKPAEVERFCMVWQTAHEAYGKKVSPQVAALVFKVLERFDLSAVEAAIGAHLGDSKLGQFAPKPADIIRLIEGDTEAITEDGWARFREATRSGVMPSEPALCSVIRRLGGLEYLGDKNSRDVDFLHGQFAALYRNAREPQRLGIAHARQEALSHDPR